MKLNAILALLILAPASAWPHRLDEYLQRTLVSVSKGRIEAQIDLTPGVAVFPFIIREIDTNNDGAISEAERRAYADKVLRDLAFKLDNVPLQPRLQSVRFPGMADLREGRGEIQLDLIADAPPGGRKRTLALEDHHLSQISAYQVNSLVSADPKISLGAQTRNYSQSSYCLDYEETDVPPNRPTFASFWDLIILFPAALLISARLFYVRRQAEKSRK